MVLAQKESLLKKVRANGLAKAAQAVGVAALPFKQVPRRQTNVYGQRLVPSLPKVGSNIDVVDAIFHTAEQTAVKYGGTRHFASLPRDQRTGSVVIPSQLSLVVYQVDHYHLITRQEFQKTMRSSGLALVVSASVRRGVQTNPLSLKSLEHRLGFQPAGEAGASSEHKKAS